MKKREFALLLVRLLGLYTISTSFSLLFSVFGYLASAYSGPPNPAPNWISAFAISVPFILQAGFGLVIWLFARSLANAMTLEMSNEIISRWQPRQMAQMALALIGVIMLGHGVGATGQAFTRYGYMRMGASSSNSYINLLIGSLAGLPSLLIGIILIAGARFLSYWISPREASFTPNYETDITTNVRDAEA